MDFSLFIGNIISTQDFCNSFKPWMHFGRATYSSRGNLCRACDILNEKLSEQVSTEFSICSRKALCALVPFHIRPPSDGQGVEVSAYILIIEKLNLFIIYM